jgi:predicted adenylyl cyclase CyaB
MSGNKMVHWLEVEVKVKVDDVAALRNKVRKIAVLKKREIRGDDYFALHTKSYPTKAFRIRFDGRKYIVNFKKPLKKFSKDAIVVKKEYEFELKDTAHIDNFLALLKEFGFKEWVKKKKQTESYAYRKDRRIVIELSKVEHLGNFMEIECLVGPKRLNAARKKIFEVLEILGVEKKDINNVGYTKALWERGFKV